MSNRKWNLEEFIEAIKTSKMISEVLRKLNMANGGGYKTFYKYVNEHNIDTSHFLHGKEKFTAITKARKKENARK